MRRGMQHWMHSRGVVPLALTHSGVVPDLLHRSYSHLAALATSNDDTVQVNTQHLRICTAPNSNTARSSAACLCFSQQSIDGGTVQACTLSLQLATGSRGMVQPRLPVTPNVLPTAA